MLDGHRKRQIQSLTHRTGQVLITGQDLHRIDLKACFEPGRVNGEGQGSLTIGNVFFKSTSEDERRIHI